MFRIDKNLEYVYRTYRLPGKLVEQMADLAEEEGISVNQVVTQCCQYAMNNLEESEST